MCLTPRRCLVGKFRSSLFKGLSEPPRSAVALRRGRNSLIVRKRHRRGEFSPTAKRGGTAQVGGSPFYAKPFQIDYPLFSLAVEAQRKKLGKKEHADKEISPRARGDQRSARWMGGRFLKKATEKLSARHRRGVLDPPTNQNSKSILLLIRIEVCQRIALDSSLQCLVVNMGIYLGSGDALVS